MTIPATGNTLGQSILPLVGADNLLCATFSGPQRGKKIPAQRITLRPVALHAGPHLQLSRFDGKKDLSTNHTPEELPAALADILAAGFANVHITTTTEEIDLRLTKKGDLLVGRKKIVPAPGPHAPTASAAAPPAPHNRPKSLALAEDDPFLATLGIADRHGRVRPTARDKFTQINEFLKLLDHALPEVVSIESSKPPSPGIAIPGPALATSPPRPLLILDCGCGSSHLTLATAHFLNHIKHIPARLLGIDANPEVITKSRDRAAKLQQTESCPIEFRAAKIGDLDNLHADIVLALHACDTATDDALLQAVRAQAKLILAVPCCHKHLNARLHIQSLTDVHHHGILHQRLADIFTDSFRALLLEVMGYHAEVIEFISPEHTARNLMIRAVRRHPPGRVGVMDRYRQLRESAGVTPYLETALAQAGLLPSSLAADPV